jgi:hypothetical protein
MSGNSTQKRSNPGQASGWFPNMIEMGKLQ